MKTTAALHLDRLDLNLIKTDLVSLEFISHELDVCTETN